MAEHVVLLHGLARSERSMCKMEKHLKQAGYSVVNIGYPSRHFDIPTLASHVRKQVTLKTEGADKIHFVTHSMGGIILRQIQKTDPFENIGRAVMMSPPNNGSEVVDTLGNTSLFKKINGPAGSQLGTQTNGFIANLGPVTFETGIITGNRTMNPVLSLMIPGRDDGKVSIKSAQVKGMKDFIVLPSTHTFIMKRKHTIEQVKYFLRHGIFLKN